MVNESTCSKCGQPATGVRACSVRVLEGPLGPGLPDEFHLCGQCRTQLAAFLTPATPARPASGPTVDAGSPSAAK
jgi:hypothetical protein